MAIDTALDKLAAYEDNGLAPEEVAELAEAKRDGRLVVLPVAIGDTAYYWSEITDDEFSGVGDYTVYGIAIKKDGFYLIDQEGSVDKLGTQCAMLTRAEAEAALERMGTE